MSTLTGSSPRDPFDKISGTDDGSTRIKPGVESNDVTTVDTYDGSSYDSPIIVDDFYNSIDEQSFSTDADGVPFIPVLNVITYIDLAEDEILEYFGFPHDQSIRWDMENVMKIALVEAGFMEIPAGMSLDDWVYRSSLPHKVLITDEQRQFERLAKSVRRWFYQVLFGYCRDFY